MDGQKDKYSSRKQQNQSQTETVQENDYQFRNSVLYVISTTLKAYYCCLDFPSIFSTTQVTNEERYVTTSHLSQPASEIWTVEAVSSTIRLTFLSSTQPQWM